MSEYKVSTEALQILSAAQACEYRLVPYRREGNVVMCYAEEGRDYAEVIQEIEVILGLSVITEPIENGELHKMLGRHYRNDRPGQSTRTAGGQGFLMKLIEEAFDMGSSDIHLEAYEERCRVRMRIDGHLIERYAIEKGNYAALVNQIKILSDMDISEKRLPQDGRIMYEGGGRKFDIRVSSLPGIYGEKIVMRLLTRRIELLELANLGFSEKQLADYCHAISKPHGLVLISGPTGSGKSTTLYATMRRLNREQVNILTIEDPIEYTLEGVNQVQLKEDIGLTFAGALRTFLRQDPDIIMLGEIRDTDTAQMAVRSSLTGHLIFSTIHTNSAWGSLARLTDMGLHPYLISNTLIMCVAQRLVRLLCPDCKQPGPNGYIAAGCPKCYYTGYNGRRALYEVIPMDDELSGAARRGEGDISNMLRERKITSIHDSAMDMLRNGMTSYEEIITLLET